MFTKTKGIFNICGDYVAFHEMGFYDQWIFGEFLYTGGETAYDVIAKKLDLSWDKLPELEDLDKNVLDNIMKDWVKNFEREDYHDYDICDCVVETDENNKVIGIYWGF